MSEDNFDFERVIKRIKERLSLTDIQEHAGICTYEIRKEFKRLGINMPNGDPRIRANLEVMLQTGLLHYKIEVGDKKFNLLDDYDDLRAYE